MISDYFGYETVDIRNLYPASTLVALYLKQEMPDVKKVRVIGNEQLIEELHSHGIETSGGTFDDEKYNDPKKAMEIEQVDAYELDPEVGAVVQGNDPAFNMSKLCIGSLYLQKGLKWVITNTDKFGTTATGRRIYGCGAAVAAMEATVSTTDGLMCEKVCVGKPSPSIL